MAKRAKISGDLFKRTEPGPNAQAKGDLPAEGRTVSVGVGLKESEVEALDQLAKSYGVARNALLRFAVRHFLTEHQAGRIELPVEQEERRSLRMP